MDMSSGLFQNLPGAHEMGGVHALPSEPWLLPISDGRVSGNKGSDEILRSVQQAAKPFRIAAHALIAAFVLMLSVQIASDWMVPTTAHRSSHQVADATPPSLPVTRAALAVSN
ncbi:hypothetical protein MKK58_18220 [Methylobacterium sp. J-078]|uniref:hypothetical protein n=1 Tax=Methylobacterium sp. J-078 TaxID=2836657 RepID=UPI001FBC0F0D|nr:hypothetical protein [Methylobacterium sp. J-078]MCJ2046454.1 hypothetical protein [Methylobacterium sp. J-078]